MRGPTVRGISIYGFGPPVGAYPSTPGNKIWPVWRSWRNVWGHFAEIYSEFTLHQTVAPSAALYALEKKAGVLDPDKLERPNPLERPKELH